MSDDEWAVRYRPDQDYVIQCLHRPSKSFTGLSGQFFARAAYEFASLAWIAEAHRPLLGRLKDFAGDSSDPLDPIAHERSMLEFFGPGDEWTQPAHSSRLPHPSKNAFTASIGNPRAP